MARVGWIADGPLLGGETEEAAMEDRRQRARRRR